MKILIIEDDIQLNTTITNFLKYKGHETTSVEDGEDALEYIDKNFYNLFIIDINIPKINGLELLKKIRQNDMATKAIIMTAHSDNSFLFEAVTLKLTKYLVKPVNRKDLKQALDLAITELEKFDIIVNDEIEVNEFYTYSFNKKSLKYKGNEISLTQKEQLFFEYLLKNRNKVCSYHELLSYTEVATLDGLKKLVKRLKKVSLILMTS